MRNFGGIMMLLGILGFFYAAQQLEKHEPAREGATISESLDRPAGRWEMGTLRVRRGGRYRPAHGDVPEGTLTPG